MMRLETSLRGFLIGLAFAGVTLSTSASANPAILFDAATGKVIEHQDAFRRWYPASLTKLMTAYVTFRAIGAGELALDSPIKMTKHSAGEPPSKMGFKAGSVMTLDNALKMMLIKSANDIAMAVGENVGGSQEAFVQRMNAEALRLGMTNSHFVNPNGLHSPDQYTTARDLALLVSAIRNEFPQHASYFAIEGLKAGKKRLMSYNMLVGRYAGADGMKTGFICASGFNMVGSATRGGRTLVAVVLGEQSAVRRTDIVAALLDRGFLANGAQSSTVATLPVYGVPNAAPVDMREEVCGKKKPAAAQSEAAPDQKDVAVKSPWLEKLPNPKLVVVGLGGATGPTPKAWLDVNGKEYADVPIPTPRPDYPPVAKASAQGDTAAN
jgi:D-alanyl-D-alanine carboxypeptidase